MYDSSRDLNGCHRVISHQRMKPLAGEYNSASETIIGNSEVTIF
jgi:hypothetical protein